MLSTVLSVNAQSIHLLNGSKTYGFYTAAFSTSSSSLTDPLIVVPVIGKYGSDLVPPEQVPNAPWVALVGIDRQIGPDTRGRRSFADKVHNMQASGASAVIIYNYANWTMCGNDSVRADGPGDLIGWDEVGIPSVLVTKHDGQELANLVCGQGNSTCSAGAGWLFNNEFITMDAFEPTEAPCWCTYTCPIKERFSPVAFLMIGGILSLCVVVSVAAIRRMQGRPVLVERPADAVLDVGSAMQAQPPQPPPLAGPTPRPILFAGFVVLILAAASLGELAAAKYGRHYGKYCHSNLFDPGRDWSILALVSAISAFAATIVTPSKQRVLAAAVAYAICAALGLFAAISYWFTPAWHAIKFSGIALAMACSSSASFTAHMLFKRQGLISRTAPMCLPVAMGVLTFLCTAISCAHIVDLGYTITGSYYGSVADSNILVLTVLALLSATAGLITTAVITRQTSVGTDLVALAAIAYTTCAAIISTHLLIISSEMRWTFSCIPPYSLVITPILACLLSACTAMSLFNHKRNLAQAGNEQTCMCDWHTCLTVTMGVLTFFGTFLIGWDVPHRTYIHNPDWRENFKRAIFWAVCIASLPFWSATAGLITTIVSVCHHRDRAFLVMVAAISYTTCASSEVIALSIFAFHFEQSAQNENAVFFIVPCFLAASTACLLFKRKRNLTLSAGSLLVQMSPMHQGTSQASSPLQGE
jgi:hypothetical protein